MTAKLVLGKGKFDSSTACLKELHRLAVALRIEFKILTSVSKNASNNEAAAYLIDLQLKYQETIPKLQDLWSAIVCGISGPPLFACGIN